MMMTGRRKRKNPRNKDYPIDDASNNDENTESNNADRQTFMVRGTGEGFQGF